MVPIEGEFSNKLFEVLEEWNEQLSHLEESPLKPKENRKIKKKGLRL